MTDKDTDEAAFPVGLPNVGRGMTLRDYFATCALIGPARQSMPEYELVALFGKNRTGITRDEIIAKDAYLIADAMLKERSK